ncbi:MAG TPA: ribokinase [Myxococcales bacterium]|jgi:ribokinase|nr:ribokinase [Myxococcales bacterium]
MSGAHAIDVAVVGKANVDYLVRGPRLPRPGMSVNGDVFHEAPGGKGANQAVAAARLGARAALLARVGPDSRGDAVIASLRAEGVDARHVLRDPLAPTGVALCQVGADGEKQILSAAGANARLCAEDCLRAADLITSARVLLVQTGVPLAAVSEAIRLARGAGARVVLDCGPAQDLPDALLAQVFLVRANAMEARAITGIEVNDRESGRAAARALLGRGAAHALVQAGEHGDVLLGDGGEVWLPRFKVARVDATGAGDAFSAAMAVYIAEGRAPREAAPFASAAAALATTALGAQAGLPRRTAVLALLSAQPAPPV